MSLMFFAMAKEWALAHARGWPPWQIGDPPRAGWYLVRAKFGDQGATVRHDYWDGEGWPLKGGYAAYTGFMEVPPV